MTGLIMDVQKIPRSERHDLIFQNFDNLEDGQSMVIVNDHDPLPLIKQFEIQRPDAFKHEYVLTGPDVWKVKITRGKKEGCCGFCGG